MARLALTFWLVGYILACPALCWQGDGQSGRFQAKGALASRQAADCCCRACPGENGPAHDEGPLPCGSGHPGQSCFCEGALAAVDKSCAELIDSDCAWEAVPVADAEPLQMSFSSPSRAGDDATPGLLQPSGRALRVWISSLTL